MTTEEDTLHFEEPHVTELAEAGPEEQEKRPRRRRNKDDDFAEDVQIPEDELFAEGRRWYFLHTYSGHENKVRHAIKVTIEQMDATDRVFHVVVPNRGRNRDPWRFPADGEAKAVPGLRARPNHRA